MKKNPLPDLFVRYMAGTPYVMVCIGLAFLRIPEITFSIIIIYITVYIVCFAVLSSILALLKYRWNPIIYHDTKNSNAIEGGVSSIHTTLIEKRYYENLTTWVFQKAFWISFPVTAVIIITSSPYL